MANPARYESIQEPLDDEERELMNPDAWDWAHSIDGVTVREPSVTLTFTREEYMAFWRLAEAQGLAVDEFVESIALAAVRAATA